MTQQTFNRTRPQSPLISKPRGVTELSNRPNLYYKQDHSNRRFTRPAFTLIETVVSLVILSSLMGSAFGLLTLVQRSNERATSNRMFRQQVRAFAKMFRKDANARDSELIFEDTGELRVFTKTKKITYQIVDGSKIVRIQTTIDQQITQRERFDFGEDIDLQISQGPTETIAHWLITDRRFPQQSITVVAGWKDGDL
ncbi:type II secretion system GspH family protein [Rubripirellula sp.]|jgi:prepilin-type N-terminal cleavage/methylation domain-containing protein|nr:type II secretion system GspH family protein [Rubripirellula sp.]